jgi:hypothetical protein
MCEIVILAHIWDAFSFLRKIGCDRTPSSFPARLYLRPSRQLTGVRAPAAAAGQPLPSLCFCLLSKPIGTRSTSPRSPWNFVRRALLSRALPSPDFAPSRSCCQCRRRRSPTTAPAELPPPITPWWAQSSSNAACGPAPATPRWRRAPMRRLDPCALISFL